MEHEDDEDFPLLNQSNNSIAYPMVLISGQIVGEDIELQQDLEDQDISIRYGKQKRVRKGVISNVWNNLHEIAQYDRETRKIMKLTPPYTIHSIFESSLETVTYALIGNNLGVAELSI